MSGSREVKGFKFSVYREGFCLGELDALPVAGQILQFPKNQICIHHMSPGSDRCSPLSILQTVSPYSVRCKLELSSEMDQSNLITLHDQCVKELKTAVVLMEDEEIHLVAMESKPKQFPCFWCYSVPVGLYNASLAMLNRRCLAMVFDLDETLIVANTMKSFGDRIKALQSWIAHETDGVRSNEMNAEVKQYMDDQMLLKQYTRNDFVVDGDGNAHKAQWEEVPWVSKNQERLFRPVIRGLRKNIVLTRINPENHDTSVLVRLRPAWEDLRSYLTANGRQRFDVYVCTRAEREYALEMWRLLDPEAHLVGLNQLLDRVICVKSGSQKSLRNVFRDGMCHPKMAMVIDDRSEVWEDKDQPRVLVVPAFTPYCYPQVETAHAVPVLCVARNVACNVRCHFFKEFDENLLQRISEVCYDDEVKNLPSAPDVSNYLIPEVFEIYAKNQEAIDARKYEVPKAIAEQTSCEVKESAIVITDERVEPERMAKTYSMVNQELQNSLSQQTYLEKNIQELKVELGRREHDYTLAMEQIIDLQNQISVIKLENKMLLNAEKRAKGEVDSLLERVHQLQREQAYAKKELKEERDNVRILTLHLEETLNNALRQFSAALDTTLHAVSSPVDEEHPQEPTRRAPKQARNN